LLVSNQTTIRGSFAAFRPLKEALTDREQAWRLLTEYTKGESLIRHCLAVEAALRAYALKYGEDEELWGAVGLIHDFDYEQHPSLEEHPMVGAEILRRRGWPEEAVLAMLSHADGGEVKRETRLQKALYAVDELTGFITAVALVRPSLSLDDLTVKSVKKKMKDSGFARPVNREQLLRSAADLGEEFDSHVDFVIRAMRPIQRELGFRPLEG
jgi:putative nucleotidyltransferase with HDIG domain